jgi:glycosyltransferase involved in cell wall biosynthesis
MSKSSRVDAPRETGLTVLVPCYNEERTVLPILERLNTLPIADLEIIVINDASSDGTLPLLLDNPHLYTKLISHKANKGKGIALQSGIGEATKPIIVIQDADLEYDPEEIPRLLDAMFETGSDAIYGSRFKNFTPGNTKAFFHYNINRFLTLFSNLMTGYRLTDMETCYKLFPADFLKGIDIQERGFGIEPELTAKASNHGLTISEVPISYSPRTKKDGKKIKWTDGARALYAILRYSIDKKVG